MSRTPFRTPFRRQTERFPDQTRPDQSLLVTQFCGVSGYSFHPSHGDLPAMDGRYAAEIGGGR